MFLENLLDSFGDLFAIDGDGNSNPTVQSRFVLRAVFQFGRIFRTVSRDASTVLAAFRTNINIFAIDTVLLHEMLSRQLGLAPGLEGCIDSGHIGNSVS
ncbi:hypothetical protein ASG11_04690 [Sphingomonas sp. Leaf357]|nr:hypothetical protein ASG11_04690 [Sphingomonas sp. Leaf357]